MVKTKTPRISDKLADNIEKDAKQRGLPENEWMTKAFEHFLICKKTDDTAPMKLIVLRYPANCLRCKGKISAGEWALYGRGVGAVCIDCYVERIGDKALIAKYLKLREWKQILKAVKAECEKFAQRLEGYQLTDKVRILETQFNDLNAETIKYLKEKIGTAEESKALENVVRATEKLKQTINEVRAFFEKLLKQRKREKIVV